MTATVVEQTAHIGRWSWCVQEGMKYGEMFAHLLKSFGVLCIGLYRFRDTETSVEQNPCAKRYVITNPPADFRLLASDKVHPSRLQKLESA